MIKRLESWLLSKLQRRCDHPDMMVAADILEGCADGIEVKYCRRCGAIATNWSRGLERRAEWRLPDPFLWAGMQRKGFRF